MNVGRGQGMGRALLLCVFALALSPAARGQIDSSERAFTQSKAAVEQALKSMQPALAGRLPVLQGFAESDRSLDRYERGYYQATVQVTPATSGGSLVRVTVKVTAWYSDPLGAKSGYQLLNSNGRLEADLLDQLAEQLAKVAAAPAREKGIERKVEPAPNAVAAAATTAAPAPANLPATSTASPKTAPPESSGGNSSSPCTQTLAAKDREVPRPISTPVPDKAESQLQAEVDSLQEILKNQAHPKNLVAVKKSGTPVVATPSLNAKAMFLASQHDEFELLDFTQDWVHVRISGLSRGWIWRGSLEMPEGIPDTQSRSATSQSTAADLFHVTREETAQFPGDWPSLRGKNVKIISVQKSDDASRESAAADKLEYAKYLLDKNYAEMKQKAQELAGIVLIFDSADGGMIAATLTTLQQWKSGTISDAALWHNCFFDPPETFDPAGTVGAQ